MSRMSELHDDLSTIHTILLGQRQVAYGQMIVRNSQKAQTRYNCINDLLLEFEAAGVVWPDNVEELNA